MATAPLLAVDPAPVPAPPPAAAIGELSFQASTAQILKHDIPWEAYLSAKLITPTDFQLLRRYDHKSLEMQSGLLEENGPAYVRTFLTVLRNVFKEETTEYTLAMLCHLVSVNRQRYRFFFAGNMSAAEIFEPLLRLLSSRNWYTLEATTRLLSQLLAQTVALPLPSQPWAPGTNSSSSSGSSSAGKVPLRSPSAPVSNGREAPPLSEGDVQPVLDTFVPWLAEQLVSPAHPTRGVQNAVSCLAAVLRVPAAREVFVRSDGVPRLLPLVNPIAAQGDLQLLYDAVLCIWLLSFTPSALEALKPTRIVKALNDVARSSTKEKVVRVVVLALNNLLLRGHLGPAMVELGLPKTVQSLMLQTWHDEDLTDALQSLSVELKHNLKDLSSFDRYKAEVLTGVLDWSPMHKDPAFWRENVMRFEDNEFQILKALIKLLSSSQDKRTLAVACYDLGQFIQFHPSGRHIALDMKAKDVAMKLMQDEDPEVRKQALFCIQKLLLSAKYVSYLQT